MGHFVCLPLSELKVCVLCVCVFYIWCCEGFEGK